MKTRAVWCPKCIRERRSRRGRLGNVVELQRPFAPSARRLLWHGGDPASARRMRNFTDDGMSDPPQTRDYWVVLVDEADPDFVAPGSLDVWCETHGADTVPTDAVIAGRV